MKNTLSKALISIFVGSSALLTAQPIPAIKWDIHKMISYVSCPIKKSSKCEGVTSNTISITVIKCDDIVAGNKAAEKVVQ